MKRGTAVSVGMLLALGVLGLLLTSQPKVQHGGSLAFDAALRHAVDRLEGVSDAFLAGTATPAAAGGLRQHTFEGRYTCETYTYDGGYDCNTYQLHPTCDPNDPGCEYSGHTIEGHTCMPGTYTCEWVTCDTYDPQQFTCDVNDPQCTDPQGHTFEPPPYNHTCEGATCDGSYTCDFTVDARAETCDAANPECLQETFDYAYPTCDPTDPDCRENNPYGYCTADFYPTCDPNDPDCPPSSTLRTTWGRAKIEFR